MIESILSGLGSIASIIGLILVLRDNNQTKRIVKILLGIIILLSVATSALSYRNYAISTAEAKKLRQQNLERMRTEYIAIEAAELLDTFPSYISEYDEGDNEGIVYGGIAFLEKSKDIYPDTYTVIKQNALADIENAKKSTSSFNSRETMKNAATAMYGAIRSIAGHKPKESSR